MGTACYGCANKNIPVITSKKAHEKNFVHLLLLTERTLDETKKKKK